MELSQVMRTMSGVRLYLPRDVPDEVIYEALDDARFAPSGGNRQPWRVVVVRDLEMRKKVSEISSREWRKYTAKWYPSPEEITAAKARKLKEGTDYHANMHQAPVHLFVWAELEALALMDSELDRVSFVGGGSVYPFVQNLQLGLSARGLGSRITSLAVPAEAEWAELLSVPDGYGLAAVMTLGYPEWKATRLSRNRVESFASHESFGGPPLTSSH
jgi:nitroreductase